MLSGGRNKFIKCYTDISRKFSFEIEDANLNPMQEAFTVEAIHAAAFANNTVGLPKIVPSKNWIDFYLDFVVKTSKWLCGCWIVSTSCTLDF